MFLRSHQRNKDDKDHRYWSLVESERTPEGPRQRTLCYLGDQILPVRSVKTIYVRFDRNDYSIPPDKVGHTLTVIASPSIVRILDGATEIARHRRCWSRHELIEAPGHREALLEQKRKAVGASPNARLLAAAPETEALLDLACSRGYSVARLARQLLHLLDDYGPSGRWRFTELSCCLLQSLISF